MTKRENTGWENLLDARQRALNACPQVQRGRCNGSCSTCVERDEEATRLWPVVPKVKEKET